MLLQSPNHSTPLMAISVGESLQERLDSKPIVSKIERPFLSINFSLASECGLRNSAYGAVSW